MADLLTGFVRELRLAGLPVSPTENLDAVAATAHVELSDREALRTALAATLVKNSGHRPAFDTVFDVHFSLRGPAPGAGPGSGPPADGPGEGGGPSPQELADMVADALRQGDEEALRSLARHAVPRLAGMAPGRPVGGSYYLYRTLRGLDLEGALARLLREAQDQSGGLGDLDHRLLTDEYRHRLGRLSAAVEDEIRRRLVADRGAEAVARSVRRPLPEELDLMQATRAEMEVLRRALRPLARRLAVRLARRRRHRRRGPLDFRSTVRHSLSTGGVPVEPRFRRPRPARPELVVVADISGSVAAFARFTLQLVWALSTEFSKLRTFVFVDEIDEVTSYLERADDVAEAVDVINRRADVVGADGHSDYGRALEALWDRWGREFSTRTTVILLGDARNNYHAASAWVVRSLAARVRHVYWLNPEPRAYWDTGDSILGEYGAHCDGVFECRNLRQLERFVEKLA